MPSPPSLDNSTRLLVSARDPAAALQLGAFCRHALTNANLSVSIVAQEPAATMMCGLGLPVRRLPSLITTVSQDGDRQELLALATSILDEYQPDVLLCGLSSPQEGGIDEALMARRKCFGIVFQDFWGELNRHFNATPDMIFALDEVARRENASKHGIATMVTGSPRHGSYSGLDLEDMRSRVRKSLNLGTYPVFGLLGQPLHGFSGYKHTLALWGSAIQKIAKEARVLYRPHPRETSEQRDWTMTWLNNAGLTAVSGDTLTTEESLVACDAGCSIMSNATYDAAYLNYFSNTPVLTPVLLLFDDELREFYEKIINIKTLPYISERLAVTVWDSGYLEDMLASALSETTRRMAWSAAKHSLYDASSACEKMEAVIANPARKAEAPSTPE